MVKTSKNDARQIRDYMKENIHGEINTNKLVQRLEKDDVMSHGKAYPAIRLAVDLGLVKEQIKYRGKIEMKYLTTDEKYEEEENSRLDKMEKLLIQFDESFDSFKKMYPGLPLDEKAYAMEGFFQFHVHFHMVVSTYHQKYEKTSKWSKLLHDVRSRHEPLSRLVSSGSKKEHAMISNHIVEGRLFYLYDSIKHIDENLKKLI